MINIASIEQQLSQQSRFCLIDWLLAGSQLFYADYEAWRYGRQNNLDESLRLDKPALEALINDTEKQCRELGLVCEPQEFYRWDSDQRILLMASQNSQQHRQLTQYWLRPQDLPQMDLFLDNSAQVAENVFLEALGSRQFDSAQQLLQKLSQLNPECSRLGGYQDLTNYGSHLQTHPVIATEALAAELQGLKNEAHPLAQEVLGSGARDYLAFAWRRLANNLQDAPFDPQQAELHQSFALLQIPDYPAVINRLTDDAGLYQQPLLLERLAISYSALRQDENALLIWCLMMELSSDYTETALERYKTHKIHQLWLDFWDLDEGWPCMHFPAFVLARQPALVHHLADLPPLRQPTSQAMATLLQQRLRGEDEIAARERLQALSPALLRVYLNRCQTARSRTPAAGQG